MRWAWQQISIFLTATATLIERCIRWCATKIGICSNYVFQGMRWAWQQISIFSTAIERCVSWMWQRMFSLLVLGWAYITVALIGLFRLVSNVVQSILSCITQYFGLIMQGLEVVWRRGILPVAHFLAMVILEIWNTLRIDRK